MTDERIIKYDPIEELDEDGSKCCKAAFQVPRPVCPNCHKSDWESLDTEGDRFDANKVIDVLRCMNCNLQLEYHINSDWRERDDRPTD